MSMFTVGLTGGLASGKTTVLNIFHQLGIDILSADLAVHQLMAHGGKAYTAIINYFGPDIITATREIDRTKLRTLIFTDPEKKRWLEMHLHPLVREYLWEQRKILSSPYVVVEIPLLAETQTPYEWINRILVVDCDEETQQLRAEKRSGLPPSLSRLIIGQQATRQKRNSITHDILVNDGDLSRLELETKKLHNKYIKLSQL